MDRLTVALGEPIRPGDRMDDVPAAVRAALLDQGGLIVAALDGTLSVSVERPADVTRPLLAAALDPAVPPIRWGIGAGADLAIARSRATAALALARRERAYFAGVTGDARADALLADLAPVLAALLRGLTGRQAEVARSMLLAGARQADIVHALGVSRASVSVLVARANVGALRHAMAAIGAVLDGAAPATSRTAALEGRPG